MDSAQVHRKIKEVFHLSNKAVKNLPFCSGWRYTRAHLADLFKVLGFTKGAEIGVRVGYYSALLCRRNPNLSLLCIDPWSAYDPKYPIEKQERIYTKAVNKLSKYNTTIIRKTSMDALSDVEDGTLDFVYIDGNHRFDYACMDIILWSHKVRSGGIVAVHDCYGGEIGVQQAVEAYVRSHYIDPWYVTKELAPTAYWVKP